MCSFACMRPSSLGLETILNGTFDGLLIHYYWSILEHAVVVETLVTTAIQQVIIQYVKSNTNITNSNPNFDYETAAYGLDNLTAAEKSAAITGVRVSGRSKSTRDR